MKYLLFKKLKYQLRNRLVPLMVLAMIALTLTSCGDLFKVKNPNTILAEDLDSPQFISALSNSAQGALSRDYDEAILVSAVLADGAIAVQTQSDGARFVDIGLIDGIHTFYTDLYNGLAATRWATTEVTKKLIDQVDNPNSSLRVAKSYFWDAIARITLADMFRKIPLNNGKPRTPIEIYEGTIDRLIKAGNIAKAAPASPERTQYLAAIYATIARVYRSLYFERDKDMNAFENAANYAEKALNVDSDFYLEILIQTPASSNTLYISLNTGNFFNIDPTYAPVIDPVTGKPDPRVPVGEFRGLGSLRQDSLFKQLKFTNRNENIPISRWQEAELILAEYALLQGNLSEAVNHINQVRSAVPLPSFSSNDRQRVYKQIKYERKAEFWLELRRWQDMRYYNNIPERWVPSAAKQGIDRRLPISLREKFGNPNL